MKEYVQFPDDNPTVIEWCLWMGLPIDSKMLAISETVNAVRKAQLAYDLAVGRFKQYEVYTSDTSTSDVNRRKRLK